MNLSGIVISILFVIVIVIVIVIVGQRQPDLHEPLRIWPQDLRFLLVVLFVGQEEDWDDHEDEEHRVEPQQPEQRHQGGEVELHRRDHVEEERDPQAEEEDGQLRDL